MCLCLMESLLIWAYRMLHVVVSFPCRNSSLALSPQRAPSRSTLKLEEALLQFVPERALEADLTEENDGG